MIEPGLEPAARRLAAEAGLGEVKAFLRLDGGGNNRVYRAEAEGGAAALKVYFHHPNDARDRLKSETSFVSLAWNGGLRCLPKPLGVDGEHRVALYEFLPGRKLEPSEVDQDAVDAATRFVEAINQTALRARATNLPVASEACFSLDAHLATVERRLDRLQSAELRNALDRDAAAFVARDVVPLWQLLERTVREEAIRMGLDPASDIGADMRCISPSDFGFHNAIRGADGTIRFIDFEYAGWDDPAKLVGDFFNQVAVPVPHRYFESFAAAVAGLFPAPQSNLARFRLLLPIYAVKWIAIVLNDFLADGEKRRAFAGGTTAIEERKAGQLAKARRALAQLKSQRIVDQGAAGHII